MKLRELAKTLGLRQLTPDLAHREDVDVKGGYASDLLSDVLANAPVGGVVVTIQAHQNAVAVAVHARLTAIIFASGRTPDENVIDKASEEGVVLYSCTESTFDVVGKLYGLGLRGNGG